MILYLYCERVILLEQDVKGEKTEQQVARFELQMQRTIECLSPRKPDVRTSSGKWDDAPVLMSHELGEAECPVK